MRNEVIQIKLTEEEKRTWFRLAGLLAQQRGEHVSLARMLRELVDQKTKEEGSLLSELPIKAHRVHTEVAIEA